MLSAENILLEISDVLAKQKLAYLMDVAIGRVLQRERPRDCQERLSCVDQVYIDAGVGGVVCGCHPGIAEGHNCIAGD